MRVLHTPHALQLLILAKFLNFAYLMDVKCYIIVVLSCIFLVTHVVKHHIRCLEPMYPIVIACTDIAYTDIPHLSTYLLSDYLDLPWGCTVWTNDPPLRLRICVLVFVHFCTFQS